MKKLLLLFAIFCVVSANAQNYLISFAGKGASGSVNTVTVENLMKKITKTLAGNEVLHLTGTVGINSMEYSYSPKLKIYPNPMTDHSTLEIYPPVAGNAVVSIYEISGKQIYNHQNFLENCRQEFRISGLNNGLYLIDIKGNTYHISGKLLSNSNTYRNLVSVERISSNHAVVVKGLLNEYKGSQSTDMEYSEGDRLKFTGISGNYSTVFVYIPNKDTTITFNFIACTDFEKNNYQVVEIGGQTWMAENLKSTKYNDGALIPLVSDSLAWLGLTTPGCCFFRNNEATYKNIYGAMYNFYAAINTKLCPSGWHVPTYDQFTALITFLGGSSVAGGKMKESGYTHWYQPNTLATNESGFTGLPAGWRGSTSKFQEMYVCGEFWTSTPNADDTGGFSYYLDYWYKAVYGENVNKKVGFSIRCLKD
jgi:uncharacterized protein (TIGR02145 family)